MGMDSVYCSLHFPVPSSLSLMRVGFSLTGPLEPPGAVTMSPEGPVDGYSDQHHFPRAAGGAHYNSSHHFISVYSMPPVQARCPKTTSRLIPGSPFYRWHWTLVRHRSWVNLQGPCMLSSPAPTSPWAHWHQTPSLERSLRPWLAPNVFAAKMSKHFK